jgi:hypothetical protein
MPLLLAVLVHFLFFGVLAILVGLLCLSAASGSVTSAKAALMQSVLRRVSFALLFPPSLTVLSLLYAASRILAFRLHDCVARWALLLLLIVALFVGASWVATPFLKYPTNVLGNYSDAELIREVFPLRLVRVEWMNAFGGTFIGWLFAETCGRLLVLTILSALALAILYRLRGQ